jgi:hypothetical protein
VHVCVRERADLRREHTRTVERVTLGEGGAKGKAEKVAKKVGGRSVSKTRDGKEREVKKTRGKCRAKKEREQELLHPPPLWDRARSAALGQCPLGGATVVVRDK